MFTKAQIKTAILSVVIVVGLASFSKTRKYVNTGLNL